MAADVHDRGQGYWLLTAILLSVGVLGNAASFVLAVGLAAFQLAHYIVREKQLKAFPVQARVWYLIRLLVSLPGPMQWLYWVPCIGTWAQVMFGYCAMVRMVSLWPWNREEGLTLPLLSKTFFSRPVRGSV